MNPIPRFFKVFLVPTCSQKLGIPLAFLPHVAGALLNKIYLRNRHGNWRVTISRDEDQFSFEGGWGRFVMDNNIKHNDFLVFCYDGGNIFSVTLYGHNCCDKEIFPHKDSVKKENENENDEENEEESNDSMGEDENFEETNGFDLNDGDYEEESEVEHLMKRKGRKRPAKKAEKAKNVKHEELFDDGDDNDDDVFKYGIISRPENPYFVTKLRATRTNDLNEEGKWEAKVAVWTDGRTWLKKGYRRFIKCNDFRKQDRCICEFVNGKDETGVYLKMTILRAGSWLPKEDI